MRLFKHFLYVILLQLSLALGAASAAVKGYDPIAGAVGATIGEVVAEKMIARAMERTREEVRTIYEDVDLDDDDFESLCKLSFYEHLKEEHDTISKLGQLAAAGTAWALHFDIQNAADAAKLAVEFNTFGPVMLQQLQSFEELNYQKVKITHEGITFEILVPREAVPEQSLKDSKLAAGASLTMDLTPGIGQVKAIAETIKGQDLITTASINRWFIAAGFIPIGKAWKLAKAGAKEFKLLALQHLQKGPYNPRAMETLLKHNNPGAKITSSTLPEATAKNIGYAGARHPTTGVVFDKRGFPIFDKHVKVETYISGDLAHMAPEAHQRAATRQLRAEIEARKVNSSMFTEKQLKQIEAGNYKIEGYTWHHHQDQGRMQLIPEKVHQDTGHMGGYAMWGSGK